MKKVLLILTLLTCSLSHIASANLITNGSFEDVNGGLQRFGFNSIWFFGDDNQLSDWAPYAFNNAEYYAEVRDEAFVNGGAGTALDGTILRIRYTQQ